MLLSCLDTQVGTRLTSKNERKTWESLINQKLISPLLQVCLKLYVVDEYIQYTLIECRLRLILQRSLFVVWSQVLQPNCMPIGFIDFKLKECNL